MAVILIVLHPQGLHLSCTPSRSLVAKKRPLHPPTTANEPFSRRKAMCQTSPRFRNVPIHPSTRSKDTFKTPGFVSVVPPSIAMGHQGSWWFVKPHDNASAYYKENTQKIIWVNVRLIIAQLQHDITPMYIICIYIYYVIQTNTSKPSMLLRKKNRRLQSLPSQMFCLNAQAEADGILPAIAAIDVTVKKTSTNTQICKEKKYVYIYIYICMFEILQEI